MHIFLRILENVLDAEQKEENEIWTARMVDATEVAEQISIELGNVGRGLTPRAAERVIKELKEKGYKERSREKSFDGKCRIKLQQANFEGEYL